jgi:iron(III) transport system permease protein
MDGLDAAFGRALARSVTVGASVAGISLIIGWPLGVRAALTCFPGRRALLTALALPLLLPSFLIAIGLSMLAHGISGFPGTVWAFACLGVPLVGCASLTAAHSITRSQADAARLAGGERHLFFLALRATFPLAALAATLAAVLTLADPGPGQILGWPGAAGELLVSFAARYDVALATRQAAALACVAALLAWPLAWKLAPHIADALLARDTERAVRRRSPFTALLLVAAVGVVTALPLAGLLRPLLGHAWPLARAWGEVARTAADTALYAAFAATIAVVLAFTAAWLLGRTPRGRRVLVALALALLAVPPALPALWLIPWSSAATLGAALALRGLPVAMLFALRAVGSMPPSWADAARVHRVPRWQFLVRVTVPWLSRWAWPAAGIAALLATAEVGTVLLLHPPGRGNLPLAIFTIMANAPEALVAMLCLFYIALAAALSMALLRLSRSA